MASLLYRLGLTSVRHRVIVTLVWLAVFVGAGVGAAALSGSTVSTFEIPRQESTTALDLMHERFGAASTGGTAQVVVQAPAGAQVTDQATAARVTALVGELKGLPGVASVSDPLDPQAPVVSVDRRAAYSTVTYAAPAQEVTELQREALLDAVDRARDGGLTVEARGDALQEQVHLGGPAEVIGVVVALLVLALTYGSLITAGMNLLTAVVGVGIGALGVITLTGFTDIQATTPVLAVMLGLAVGIDYALFIITRFRHELNAGRPVPEAAAMAVGTAGSAVVTAGLTVVIALAGLAVAGIPFLTQMGLAAAASVVVAVLIAITLVPAMTGFVGHRALPRRSRTGARHAEAHKDHGFYAGWARLVTRHRWGSLLAAVAALAVIAVPVASMRTSLVQHPAEGGTQAKAEQIISESFGAGFTGPLLILIDGTDAPGRAAAVRQQTAALPHVALATAPRTATDRSAALITVVPGSGPDSAATTELVHTLRADLTDTDGARIYVTGTTAVNIDVSQKLDDALPRYLALVVGLALVLLVLVFRSLLVPIVGVLGFLLTIGATLGATTAVFQWGWLADLVNARSTGPLMSLSPIIIIGILFGLAMDYQVFLVSRMHEAHSHGADPRTAVTTGFRQAAPVVMAAATIMFAVFAGFVPQGDATIKPIAFALATGILFDAVVIRMIAVPAALALLGSTAWKLPRALRRLPVLDVEGAALRSGSPDADAPELEPAASL
ncbi:RND superfamily putative drug exporter [Actinocorallia herbida]|uniref:RND superfamily putative drug exporter n=1 Tax=Actinocorallia herbida TaxID=58109 RepID=A0A3N1CW95_9ACTN|nr:MMPL family transporter [Actinocorallia herbida]ROO84988.1 RND superfamily putative drug exporter [Actinocorallia herbida]